MTPRDPRDSLAILPQPEDQPRDQPRDLPAALALALASASLGCADGGGGDADAVSETSGEAGDEGSGGYASTGQTGEGGTGETEGGDDGTTAGADTTDSGAGTDGGDGGDCQPNPADPLQYVIVGFWNGDPTCSGDPIKTNAFPVDPADPCYCWPGNSGMNSADGFTCDSRAGSFTYTQYNSLTCGAGDDTPTEKTTFLDSCTQDIPMNLYSKIVDFGACGG